MAQFTTCLQIVNAMPQRDQDALLARLEELQAQGMSPKEAQLQAAIDVLAQVEREGQIRKSADRYVTQQEISAMERQAFARLQEDPGYKELTAKIAEAEEAGRNRFNQVVDKAVEMLKSRPGFKKISEEFDEKTVRNLAQVFIGDADAAVPEATPSLGDATRARQDYVERFLKDAGIPEPRAFWDQANQDRGYYNSPAFRRWFKGSKAVDANGRPLVAFHVTTNDFVEFDTGAGKTRGQKSTAAYSGQLGSWFTAPSLYSDNYEPGNAEAAVEGFVEDNDGNAKPGAVTMPVHLSIQNPMEYSDFESMLEDRDSYPSIAKFKADLVAQGYDGIVVRNSDTDGGVDRDDWVAFEATQIKSAIGNNGQFDPANPDIRKSVDRTETPAFKRWSGNAPLVRLGEKHEFRSGQPVVVEALHGTTNADLTEFKRSRANIESDMGAGFYASNTPEDVAANYANVDGPDLTQRVEMLAERLAQNDEFEDDMDAAREEARRRLSEGSPNTMKLFMRFKNPAVFGGLGETLLDFNEDYNEETDEYGEASGLLLDFAEALREIAPEYNASDREIESAIGKLFEQAEGAGIKVSEALNTIKSELMDASDDEGNNASSEVFRQALSRIGFDGVIDTTVYGKFGPRMIKGAYTQVPTAGMSGMTEDTVHFIAFEPEQIKSATGNSGEFGENRNILKSVDRPQFYSQLQRAIEGVPDRLSNMGAAAWKQWLTANAPKLGVKADEIEWSGIKDYLDLQGKAKLSKDDLARYLDESGVKVGELTLSGDKYYRDASGSRVFDHETGDFVAARNPSKYGNYTLPGGANYREVLLTLPSKFVPKLQFKVGDEIETTFGTKGVIIKADPEAKGKPYTIRSASGMGYLYQTQIKGGTDPIKDPSYTSSHWNEANVIAHLRVNDRMVMSPDVDLADIGERIRAAIGAKSVESLGNGAPALAVSRGAVTAQEARWFSHSRGFVGVPTEDPKQRVLFVEEIQSDWSADYRKVRESIKKAVESNFEGIVAEMKAAGVLEVNCD